MAEEIHYSSSDTPPSNKRKYEEPTESTLAPSSARRTGFSSGPISPDLASGPPTHHPALYNSVPPPPAADDVQAQVQNAKLRAQEIASRLLSGGSVGGGGGAVGGFDSKRARVENGGGFDSSDGKPTLNSASLIPISYGYGQGTSKKIDIPNGRVGVVIGKGGETIKYLQLQSGAKIQVTRDMDSDPNLPTRTVELMGTPEQIAKAEQLINDVLAEAEAGGSAMVTRRVTGQSGSGDQYVMKVPNNKVGLVIGKGGETIKNMQARTGARIQVIPLHLPPGDNSSDRNIHIDGTPEQIEAAKQLINEVTSEGAVFGADQVLPKVLLPARFQNFSDAIDNNYPYNRFRGFRIYRTVVDTNMEFYVGVWSTWLWVRIGLCWSNSITTTTSTNRMRNQGMSGGYPSHHYQARAPSSWGAPGGPTMQQPGYSYSQPGMYPGPSSQYDMGQPQYGSYPPQSSGGYNSSWDQSGAPPSQHGSQGGGYDYYSQQPPQQQQQQTTGGPGGAADNSGYGYSQPPPTSYGQPGQGYSQDGYGGYPGHPSSGYGQPPHYDQQGYNTSSGYNTSASYGTQGDSTQAPPPVQPSSVGQQGYGTAGYPQAGGQIGYGVPPGSQAGFGSQAPQHVGYGSYGPPQGKTPGNPPPYGQTQQSPSSGGGYSQPPASYSQPDAAAAASQRTPPPSGYSAGAAQSTYGSAYGAAPPTSQPGYGQPLPSYGSYGAYQQPPAAAAYPTDSSAPPPTTQAAVPPAGAANASPPS